MTHKDPLTATTHDLIAAAQRHANRVFEDDEYVAPIVHAVTANGQNILLSLIEIMRDKDLVSVSLQKFFAERNIIKYVMISEAWILKVDVTPEQDVESVIPHGSLEHHPDRIEVVSYMAESYEEGSVTATQTIVRPKEGKPYLEPLQFQERANGTVKGRFVGLLPKRGRPN